MEDSLPSAASGSSPWLQADALMVQREDRVLFEDLSFALAPGEVLQIEGRNGSGKTTLLRILCGFTRASEGRVLWRGEEVAQDPAGYTDGVVYVGHHLGIKEELTPLENLDFARAMARPRQTVSPEDALNRLGLPPECDELPCRKLSAGQRRRVAMARLLLLEARLWVLDEPFTALDVSGRALVEELLREHLEGGGLAVIATHHEMDLGRNTVRKLVFP